MQIDTIVCGPLDVNCYIVRETGSETCVLIDPAEAAPVLNLLEANWLVPTHILLTHGHFDHIGGVARIARETGAHIAIHESDAYMLQNETANLAAYANQHVDATKADILLHDGDVVEAGGLTLRVLHTPGHSQGSVSFHCGDAVFSGDTLFRFGVGRADLPGADADMLFHSITEVLFKLPGNPTVYPGHMRTSTMEMERTHNPFTKHYKGHLW